MSWATMRRSEKLAWTQVFLDYPPVFPGFTMMMKSISDWRDGRPTTYEKWVSVADQFSTLGYTPLLYAYVQACVDNEQREKYTMQPDRWGILPRAIANGLQLKVTVLDIYARGPEHVVRRIREVAVEKRRREITRRVELELKQELGDLDNL